jgi:hypothetical protein
MPRLQFIIRTDDSGRAEATLLDDGEVSAEFVARPTLGEMVAFITRWWDGFEYRVEVR